MRRSWLGSGDRRRTIAKGWRFAIANRRSAGHTKCARGSKHSLQESERSQLARSVVDIFVGDQRVGESFFSRCLAGRGRSGNRVGMIHQNTDPRTRGCTHVGRDYRFADSRPPCMAGYATQANFVRPHRLPWVTVGVDRIASGNKVSLVATRK